MRLDLHCHSTCSDGSLSPKELARKAGEFGVELFCLTDHDSFDGYEDSREVLADCRVLRGLELTCRLGESTTVHLLIYGLRRGAGLDRLSARLKERMEERRQRLVKIVGRLADLGIGLDVAEILQRCHGRTPGRPDVARALVEAGVCRSIGEAFSRFLKDGGPADVRIPALTVAEGVALGREAGGVMSIAHPHTLPHFAVVRELYREQRDQGLEGLEAWYGSYSAAQREPWLRLARDFGLVVTGGSDYHGDAAPAIARPGIEMPDPYAQRLLEWLPAPEA